MKKLKVKEQGITLIALVVTIVVLLILAGVSISMLTGENGIITQAQNAKEKNGKATVIEKAKVDLIEEQAKNESGTVDSAMLKNVLDKYFIDVPVENQITTEWVKTAELTSNEENGEYQIKVSEIYNGEIKKEEILAKDVLIPNSNGETAEEKSPYIMYNNLLCRVLYNDETHGLQIITNDNVDEVTLGSGDPTVNASDFNYDGSIVVDDYFKKTILSYNNAVDTLNNKAKGYQGTKAIDARSIGSIAILENGKFQGDTSEIHTSTYSCLTPYNLNGKLMEGDYNYREDVNQIITLDLKPTGNTWLASRCMYYDAGEFIFGVYLYNLRINQASDSYDGFCIIRSDSFHYDDSTSLGFRPVFLLPSDIRITDGNGTLDNPYVI